MSQATTDTAIISPETDSVHKRGNGFKPACINRLHNVDDDTEFRLTQLGRTDEGDRCGHPECFGGDQQ